MPSPSTLVLLHPPQLPYPHTLPAGTIQYKDSALLFCACYKLKKVNCVPDVFNELGCIKSPSLNFAKLVKVVLWKQPCCLNAEAKVEAAPTLVSAFAACFLWASSSKQGKVEGGFFNSSSPKLHGLGSCLEVAPTPDLGPGFGLS